MLVDILEDIGGATGRLNTLLLGFGLYTYQHGCFLIGWCHAGYKDSHLFVRDTTEAKRTNCLMWPYME
jgi:hypothetical protein